VVLIAAVVAVVALVPLWGGRYSALTEIRLRQIWLVPAAFVLQVLILALFDADSVLLAPALHLVSYLLVGAFVVLNRSIRWLWVVGLGWACNTLVIAANGGVMPTSEAAARTLDREPSTTFENSAVLDDPRLLVLGDVIVSPAWLPFRNAYSIGDILLVVGLVLVVWSASRRPAAVSTDDRARAADHP
jgi:hypothetical protein